MQHNYMKYYLVKFTLFYKIKYRQCPIAFNRELQIKSKRKPIKVWSTYSPTETSGWDVSQAGMWDTSQ